MAIIGIQNEFRPALPTVFASKDYREFRATLEEMDHILTASGIEHRFIMRRINELDESVIQSRSEWFYKTFRLALRYSILLAITGESYRALSRRVADSHLFQWFTHTAQVDGVRPVSKSTIERFEKKFTEGEVSELIHDLNKAISDRAGAQELLYRETELRFDEIFADSTCVKANIHFPVDWVLLRDAARTLIKAIMLIREHGLFHRIGPPEQFINKMNKLCIEMTHTRKKKNGKKMRKAIFRRMKKLMKTITKHAENYHFLLETHWEETDWSELETKVVLDRITRILDLLPQAVQQAHERIIGERRVANKDKILSLYESDIHVLVRGKSNAEVEFGNALYLAEQADGLIVDWKFIQDQPSGDSFLVEESIERMVKHYGPIGSYSADRGFDSADNRNDFEHDQIFNGICPRSVEQLKQRLEDERFCLLQKRRGNTEARMAIFKNAYLGRPLRSKGFTHRHVRIEWCIFAHNLWKLGHMAVLQRAKNQEKAADAA
jgi:hypothetical protein